MESVADFVYSQPVVDVHEHHLPELVQSTQVNLLQLFQQSYAGWTQARPYPLPNEARESDPMLDGPCETTWEALAPYLEHSGSSMFVRNLVRALEALYSAPTGISSETWQSLDEQVQNRHSQPDWHHTVLQQAGICHVITDAYSNPLLNARSVLGPNYSSVMRINAFAFGWHPESCDHNGNRAHEMLQRNGLSVDQFEQYLESIEALIQRMPAQHQVAVKNALAYDRSLDFSLASKAAAQRAWGQANPSPEDQKQFGDFIVDHICTLCAQYQIPMQMHLGTALIQGSHPLQVAPLIERHPNTQFLLMHLAYPWSRDLLGMAFVYRNIWLDLTWAALLSPSHFRLALHEAIELLPDDGRMMFGGDNWHVEETFGTIATYRSLLIDVLDEKVNSHYFSQDHACRLAGRILNQNAQDFFKLPSPSHDET